MILLFFGIIYPWVSLENRVSVMVGILGSMLGFIFGLKLGTLSDETYKFRPHMTLAIATVGLVSGYPVGKCAYDFYRKRLAQNELIQQHQEFMIKLFRPPGADTQQQEFISLSANEDGDFLMYMEWN